MSTTNNFKVKVGDKEFTNDQFSRLLNFDDVYKFPTSFVFDDTRNLLFFLCNQKNNLQTIHYIDLSSSLKEIKTLLNYSEHSDELSMEAILQRERQRVMTSGITSFTYFEKQGRFLVDINSKIHFIDIGESGVGSPVIKEIPGETYNISLTEDHKMVAYIKEGNIWVTVIENGETFKLTNSPGGAITSGDSKFVYAEEFSRYTGFWWSPTSINNQYSILYVEEDESKVMEYSIPDGDIKGKVTTYNYPLAGEDNSKVTLKCLSFDLTDNKVVLKQDKVIELKKYCQWFEYIVRAGWTPCGQSIWVQLQDRAQSRLELLKFQPFTDQQPDILFQEISNSWINQTDLLYFCKESNQFIISSETSGFRHLYMVSWEKGNDHSYSNLKTTQLTFGDWTVKDSGIWVNEDLKLISFVATKDSPIQSHLYSVSFNGGDVNRLTKENHYHTSISFSPNMKRFISNYSNLQNPVKVEIYETKDQKSYSHFYTIPNINPSNLEFNTEKVQEHKHLFYYETLSKIKRQLFSFTNSKGFEINGKIVYPPDYDSTKQYPTVLFIYGGPHVQMVTDQYTHLKHIYAYFGFVVVFIDNMGSSNRGVAFESPLKLKMGTIEIQDFTEGIDHLVNNKIVSIDKSRIAIIGWSYGGYLSLCALGQRPDFFKIAISGAPVSLWEAYNTGYTERYMSTPKENPEGYKQGSTLTYIKNFPDQENRLIIIHGLADENVHFSNTSVLIEALTDNQKPYILKILTKERHSVRNIKNSIYIESTCISHLLKHL